MKKIKLTQGKWAIVDNADFPWVNRRRWYYAHGFGACANRPKHERDALKLSKKLIMHRYILNAPDHLQVDHANGNNLDNRRKNIRGATASQNRCNWKNRSNKHGMRGIYWHPKSKRFVARVTVNYKCINLGYFKTALAARRAYCKAARKYHGKFAFGLRR